MSPTDPAWSPIGDVMKEDLTPVHTALQDLQKRVEELELARKNGALATITDIIRLGGRVSALEVSHKLVVSTLKGLLELGKGQSADQKEMLDVLTSLNKVDQNLLDMVDQLAKRMEENENAANLGQSPSRWRAVQAEIDAANEGPPEHGGEEGLT